MTEAAKYQQLQPDDRMTMASLLRQGFSARAMALMLGRSLSTVIQELVRNTLADLAYGSHTARMSCLGRRVAARPVGELDFAGFGWSVVPELRARGAFKPAHRPGTLRDKLFGRAAPGPAASQPPGDESAGGLMPSPAAAQRAAKRAWRKPRSGRQAIFTAVPLTATIIMPLLSPSTS